MTWNINTVKKDEYMTEMKILVKQIKKNNGNAVNLDKIETSLLEMVEEIKQMR